MQLKVIEKEEFDCVYKEWEREYLLATEDSFQKEKERLKEAFLISLKEACGKIEDMKSSIY